jgi:hypothetical protein
MARPRLSTVAAVGLYVAVALAVFIPFHSGERGLRMCEREGFGGPGTVSWFPPGTKCEGGLPTFTKVYFDPAYIVLLVVVVWPLLTLILLGLRRLVRRFGRSRGSA